MTEKRMNDEEHKKAEERAALKEEATSFQVKEYIYREYKLDSDFPVAAFLRGQFVFKPEPPVMTWLHFHNCMEIMYCYEERIVNIENRIYFLEPGSICVIPPNQMHNSKSETLRENLDWPGCEYIYLDPQALLGDFFTETYSFNHVFEQINRDLKNVISINENPLICRQMYLILEELRKPDCSRYMVKGLFLTFWIELLRTRHLFADKQVSKRRELTNVYPAMVYVRKHFAEPISTEMLAKICHMSLSQFRKNFKKCVGISPTKYIDNLRLSQSCQLLLETEMGILQVAFACGYNSLSSYNSHFTGKYGISPSKWKKEQRAIKKKAYSHSVYYPEGENRAQT